MAKPRNRPDKVDTDYFEGVTPLWVKPSDPPVPHQYRSASLSLADWAGKEWPDNDRTGFFAIRHYCVTACERWRSHDWERDIIGNQYLRDAKQAARHLLRTTKRFRSMLDRSNIHDAWDALGLEIAFALSPDETIDLRDTRRSLAIQASFDAFEKRLQGFEDPTYRFGPLLYRHAPRKVRPETALAIVLADIVTECRRDGARCRRGQSPRRAPKISENTPWKAIAEFVKANSDDPEDRCDPEGIQASVESHLISVHEIDLFP